MKVKAVERNISFQEGVEKFAYVMQPELYSKLSSTKVIKEAALRSGISRGAINAAWEAIGEVIQVWATEGHSVEVPGLGTMRFGIRSQSVDDVNKVDTKLITGRRVIFTPNVEIKDELKRTPITITCYDRSGKLVKQVSSGDSGEVEDPEHDNPNGGTQAGTGSAANGGTQSGGSGTPDTGAGSEEDHE